MSIQSRISNIRLEGDKVVFHFDGHVVYAPARYLAQAWELADQFGWWLALHVRDGALQGHYVIGEEV